MTGVLPYGADAALVELACLEEVLALHEALRADLPTGVTELVPAARTVLVRYDPDRTTFPRLADALRHYRLDPAARAEHGAEVTVAVRYDGPDLAGIAERCRLTPRDVVARHTAGRYTAAFCGFAPGFAYLTGLDPALHAPRRASPRTRVPAGAVAVAGEYTAVYPRPSPGGWHIIGHTDHVLWDLDRDPPATLLPGTAVRFVEAAV